MVDDPAHRYAPSWKSLSHAQQRVLTAVADGPKRTSKTTHHDVVSGACATGLVTKGLLRRTGKWSEYVELTDLGREVLGG